MTISHIAVWVANLEEMRLFYETWFGARSGAKYENSKKRFESYFLSFDSGIRIELMKKDGVAFSPCGDESCFSGAEDCSRFVAPERVGYAHLAFSTGSEAAVDDLTKRLAAAGTPILSGPRRTGDGYYESVIADPEGNLVEITA